jgi:hypothetical protein
MTLRLMGYGPWTYIDSSSASTATTELDQTALGAVRVYVRVEAWKHLVNDRAKFQQFQQTPGNTDSTLLGLLQLGQKAENEWRLVRHDLARMRKAG